MYKTGFKDSFKIVCHILKYGFMFISAKLIFPILEQSEESIQFFNLCTMYILCLIFIGITVKNECSKTMYS